MTQTVVNAGFSRPLPRRPGRKRKYEWRNVAGIHVPLPGSSLGEQSFRREVEKSAPPGGGWQLEGYAIVKELEAP